MPTTGRRTRRSAEEAAAWVKYANVTKHYGVKYWELGNEIPGDGTYGAHWEEEKKPLGATTYANNIAGYIADYITQMKAVDPSIKVGAVLTTYNSWPDGSIATQYGDTADWNNTVLKRDGSKLDFVIVHDYPSSSRPPKAAAPSLLGGPLRRPAVPGPKRRGLPRARRWEESAAAEALSASETGRDATVPMWLQSDPSD